MPSPEGSRPTVAVYAPPPWWRRRRTRALVLPVVVSLASLALLVLFAWRD